MTVTVVLLALWATLAIARETPIGWFLHRAMVELPAAALNRVTRGQIILTVAVIGLACLHVYYEQADGVRLLSMAVPDIAAWLVTFEISAYLEVVAALVASMAMRLQSLRAHVMAILAPITRRWIGGDARPRCSRHRGHSAPANDDEDGAGLALAS